MPPKTSFKQYVDSGLVSAGSGTNESGPSDLDYLIHTLRNPTPDTSVQKVLGYMYHYLPYVKHEHNLRLVLSNFLNNRVCFSGRPPSFEENYLIIEVFKLIFDKKLKVSQPTLPIKSFYEVIGKELQSFVAYSPFQNSWKVLPVIAGIFLSKDLRDNLYTSTNIVQFKWFFSEWDENMNQLFRRAFELSASSTNPPDIVNLALLSLALKYHRHDQLEYYTGKVEPSLLINGLVNLVFSQSPFSASVYRYFGEVNLEDPTAEQLISANVTQKPVVKHLNRISFILESLLQELPHTPTGFRLTLAVAERIKIFTRDLNFFVRSLPQLNREPGEDANNSVHQAFWFSMKGILFAQVIVFQGILTRFMSAKNHSVGFLSQIFRTAKSLTGLEREYQQICLQILHSYYYTNFILMSIGQGGFDGYNFTYYLSIEIVLHNNRGLEFETFTKQMIGNNQEVNLYPDALNNDYVGRCKALFVFGLWENYLRQSTSKDPCFTEFIFDLEFDVVRVPHIEDSSFIEAVHSVLLVYFSTIEATDRNLGKTLKYFELLADQFPVVLSANQLSVAVETLGKRILSTPVEFESGAPFKNSADEFLNFVFDKCAQTPSGILVRKSNSVTLSSAQPISEIDAASTLSQIEEDDLDKEDIVERNKSKKPKDLPGLNIGLTAQGASKQEHFETRTEPETTREALVVAFLNIIPYLPLGLFLHWLTRVWELIQSSNPSEKVFLTERLWKVISENLDINRSEIAYEWWYESTGAVEKNIVARLLQAKL